MSFETLDNARRLAVRFGMIALAGGVALSGPACASKEKVATGSAGAMDMGMSPPPITAAFDHTMRVADGAPGLPAITAGGPGLTR